jgi:hypothetical protein
VTTSTISVPNRPAAGPCAAFGAPSAGDAGSVAARPGSGGGAASQYLDPYREATANTAIATQQTFARLSEYAMDLFSCYFDPCSRRATTSSMKGLSFTPLRELGK